jgi:hypothetical protein
MTYHRICNKRRVPLVEKRTAPSSGTPEFTSVIYGVHVAQSAPSSGTPEFTSVIYGVHVAQSLVSHVVFCRLFVLFFYLCIVCPSIYDCWFPYLFL